MVMLSYRSCNKVFLLTKEIEMSFVLKTERLVLRPLDIEDLDTVHEYASDVENTKYMIQ